MADQQDIRVVLESGMHFEGYGWPAGDGVTVHLDAKESAGGEGKGVRPQSLTLVSLAGCTAMDVISILRKKRQDITDFEVRVRADRADEHPRVYTHIWVTYIVTGHDVDPAAIERSIELSVEKYCPVIGLLKDVVPIDTEYEIREP